MKQTFQTDSHSLIIDLLFINNTFCKKVVFQTHSHLLNNSFFPTTTQNIDVSFFINNTSPFNGLIVKN